MSTMAIVLLFHVGLEDTRHSPVTLKMEYVLGIIRKFQTRGPVYLGKVRPF